MASLPPSTFNPALFTALVVSAPAPVLSSVPAPLMFPVTVESKPCVSNVPVLVMMKFFVRLIAASV